MAPTRIAGFSLVEILIVVVIVGILAAVIAPQFANSSESARFAATVDHLKHLREQIDLYRNQHLGRYPGVAGSDPDLVFAEQMTLPTNAAGDRSPNSDQGFSDPDYPFGPYIPNLIPPNPFNNSRRVRSVTTFPSSPPGGGTGVGPGWIYEVTSGRIKINKEGDAPDGRPYWQL